LLHIAEKHLENTKKTREKHVEEEGERSKEAPSSFPGARVFYYY
jgi:hypothetical protein